MKYRAILLLTLISACLVAKANSQTLHEKPVKQSITIAVGPIQTRMIEQAFHGRSWLKLYPIALISYKRIISKRWQYGLTGAYEPTKHRYSYGTYAGQSSKPSIIYYSRAFTIAAEGSLNYFTTPSFAFYGSGSIGLSYSKKTPKIAEIPKDESFFLNGHVTPLGFRFGKKIGVSAEIGIGYKGLLNLGIDYRY